MSKKSCNFAPENNKNVNDNTERRAMIDFIRGKIAELSPTSVVLDVNGVGYELNITLPTYSALLGKEETKLFVYEAIREDAHDLYGFPSKGERQLFLALITVSGVGPGSARMILSGYTATEIRQLIAVGNAKALSNVKGLGIKTAQKIIVELKDKVLKIDLGDNPGAAIPAAGMAGASPAGRFFAGRRFFLYIYKRDSKSFFRRPSLRGRFFFPGLFIPCP